MRAVAQRVTQASVTVDGQVIGAFDEPGLLVFVGVTHDDTTDKARKLAAKLWGLRILDGEKSCSDLARRCSWSASSPSTRTPPRAGGRPGTTRRPARSPSPGRRPSSSELRRLGARVETGQFGADMKVALVNDGPVTIIIEL